MKKILKVNNTEWVPERFRGFAIIKDGQKHCEGNKWCSRMDLEVNEIVDTRFHIKLPVQEET